MLLDDIGNRIRGRREKLGLKQQDIANALDVSPQAVSKWERGENAPDVTVLKPLARLLGVSIDWLLAANDAGRDTFDASVFVSAVNGAHQRALATAPRDFALWANGVFNQLTEITLANDGVPVKYMGDGFLAFFSGTDHGRRALQAAFQARDVISEDVRIGLSTGQVYLGTVGHPDYARPDIMGEVVNVAFLTQQWAARHADSGVAATQPLVDTVESGGEGLRVGKTERVHFKEAKEPVTVCEIAAPVEP